MNLESWIMMVLCTVCLAYGGFRSGKILVNMLKGSLHYVGWKRLKILQSTIVLALVTCTVAVELLKQNAQWGRPWIFFIGSVYLCSYLTPIFSWLVDLTLQLSDDDPEEEDTS